MSPLGRQRTMNVAPLWPSPTARAPRPSKGAHQSIRRVATPVGSHRPETKYPCRHARAPAQCECLAGQHSGSRWRSRPSAERAPAFSFHQEDLCRRQISGPKMSQTVVATGRWEIEPVNRSDFNGFSCCQGTGLWSEHPRGLAVTVVSCATLNATQQVSPPSFVWL